MSVVKKLGDKVLLAATGVGIGAAVIGYISNRNNRTGLYQCPYHRTPHEMTEVEFAQHIATLRRNG